MRPFGQWDIFIGCHDDCHGVVIKFQLRWVPGLILGLRPANERRCYFVTTSLIGWALTRTDPRPVMRPAEGPNSFHWKNVGSFILLHKISRTACCFGIRTFLKQYNCYESATISYTDHQYLAQYSEIINNLQEIPLIFCNYAVRSCGTWRKGPGQSPCNVLSISDLELYVTETGTGVCDPVTD